jgi:hypothetical protein
VTDRPLTKDTSAAILAAVEKNLKGIFTDGAVIDVTSDVETDAYLAKAAATTDPVLAAGYRKLAKKAGKK